MIVAMRLCLCVIVFCICCEFSCDDVWCSMDCLCLCVFFVFVWFACELLCDVVWHVCFSVTNVFCVFVATVSVCFLGMC